MERDPVKPPAGGPPGSGGTEPWYRRGPERGEVPLGREPEEVHPVGAAERARLRVFVRHRVFREIRAFVDQDASRERGGILLGHACQGAHGPFVLVEAAIPTRSAEVVPGGLTFTQRAWDDMQAAWRQSDGPPLVTGWFHSRPGAGVVLSGHNRFTAQRFFPRWWQLTWLTDPKEGQHAVYVWSNGQLAPLPGFFVCPDDAQAGPPEPLALQPEQVPAYVAPARRAPARSMWGYAPALAAAALAAFLFVPGIPGSLPWTRQLVQERISRVEAGLEHVARLQESAARLQRWAEGLQAAQSIRLARRPPADRPAGPGATPQGPLAAPAAPSAGAAAAARPPLQGGARVGASGATPGSDTPRDGVQRYVIQPGDTLWRIAAEHLGDPFAYPKLAALNAIGNPDLILPGWELTIPRRDAEERDEWHGD